MTEAAQIEKLQAAAQALEDYWRQLADDYERPPGLPIEDVFLAPGHPTYVSLFGQTYRATFEKVDL